METLLIDSSLYIASLKKSDFFNQLTREFFLTLQKKMPRIIAPGLVVLETANVLKLSIHDTFLIFKDSIIIDIDLNLINEIIPFFKKINLKTSDAIITAIAKIYKAQLISWDKKLVKESSKVVESYTPKDYLVKLK